MIICKTLYISRSKLAVSYGGGEFAVVLPSATAAVAVKIAETIREEVKEKSLLSEKISTSLQASPVTVNLGISCKIPSIKESPSILVYAAEEALSQARKNLRDRIYVSTSLNYGLHNH